VHRYSHAGRGLWLVDVGGEQLLHVLLERDERVRDDLELLLSGDLREEVQPTSELQVGHGKPRDLCPHTAASSLSPKHGQEHAVHAHVSSLYRLPVVFDRVNQIHLREREC
jgi:hypothetical protein